MPVANAEAAAGDDIETVVGDAHDRQIGLDAATLVAELRVRGAARRLVEIVGGDALQGGERARAAHLKFRERALIDQRHALADRLVLGADMGEPAGAAFEGGHVLAFDAGGRKPVGAFPAEARAEDSALIGEGLVERRAAAAASRMRFLDRPMDQIVAVIGLHRALMEIALAEMMVAEAADVEGPEIHLRLAMGDPLRQRAAGAAAGGDARREAAGDEEIVELGRLAHDRLAVGRDRDRAVDEIADAHFVEDRQALGRGHGDGFEAVEVAREELAAEIEGHAAGPEGHGVVLPTADGKRAGLGL